MQPSMCSRAVVVSFFIKKKKSCIKHKLIDDIDRMDHHFTFMLCFLLQDCPIPMVVMVAVVPSPSLQCHLSAAEDTSEVFRKRRAVPLSLQKLLNLL